MSEEETKIWCIGADRTEYYAAHSEEEMRQFYIGLVGKQQAEEDFEGCFEELAESELDAEFEMEEDGEKRKTTWRKELIGAHIPCQISTGYNYGVKSITPLSKASRLRWIGGRL